MTEKEKLLEYIKKPVLTTARNSMGCDENWYNSYFVIKETFSIEEINSIVQKCSHVRTQKQKSSKKNSKNISVNNSFIEVYYAEKFYSRM